MTKKKKVLVFTSAALAVVLVGAVVWIAVSAYSVSGARVEMLWKRIECLSKETPESSFSPEEIARIEQKNAKIQQYTEYLTPLCDNFFRESEYTAHQKVLDELYAEILELETEATVFEELAQKFPDAAYTIKNFYLPLVQEHDSDYTCHDIGSPQIYEAYVKVGDLDAVKMQKALDETDVLAQQIAMGKLTLKEMHKKTANLLKLMEEACPTRYMKVITFEYSSILSYGIDLLGKDLNMKYR